MILYLIIERKDKSISLCSQTRVRVGWIHKDLTLHDWGLYHHFPCQQEGFFPETHLKYSMSWVIICFKVSEGDFHSVNRKSRERTVNAKPLGGDELYSSYNITEMQLDTLIPDEAKAITVATVAQLLKLPRQEAHKEGKGKNQ